MLLLTKTYIVINLHIILCKNLAPVNCSDAGCHTSIKCRSAFSTSSSNTTSATSLTNNTSKIKVIASFFPIYEFVKKVGGGKVDASVLIPVGAEPHDFDPTIQQIQNAQSAASNSIQWSRNGSNMDK